MFRRYSGQALIPVRNADLVEPPTPPKSFYGSGGVNGANGKGAPKLKSAPPVPPNTFDDGGGDGDGDDGSGWFFPSTPPAGSAVASVPYVVQSLTTAICEPPMYVVATVPFLGPGVVWSRVLQWIPPPVLIAYWIYPVSYIEVQVRQYFRTKYPIAASPIGPPSVLMLDHNESAFRAEGWIGCQPVCERKPIFSMSHSADLTPYEPRVLDTPYSDWCAVTIPGCSLSNISETLKDALLCSKMSWLNPPWLKFSGELSPPLASIREQYIEAYSETRMHCVQPQWKGMIEFE